MDPGCCVRTLVERVMAEELEGDSGSTFSTAITIHPSRRSVSAQF